MSKGTFEDKREKTKKKKKERKNFHRFSKSYAQRQKWHRRTDLERNTTT